MTLPWLLVSLAGSFVVIVATARGMIFASRFRLLETKVRILEGRADTHGVWLDLDMVQIERLKEVVYGPERKLPQPQPCRARLDPANESND